MRNAMKITGAVLALGMLGSLGGCATASQTHAPDGRMAYTVNCSGAALSWAACQKKAGDMCGSQGYRVLSQTGDKGWVATAGGAGFFGGSVVTRSMLIECGNGDA